MPFSYPQLYHVYITFAFQRTFKGTIKAHSSYRDAFHMLYWSSSRVPRHADVADPSVLGRPLVGLCYLRSALTCVRACVLLSSIRSRAPFRPRFHSLSRSPELHSLPLVVDMPPNQRLPRCCAGY